MFNFTVPDQLRKILRASAPLPFVTLCGLGIGFMAGVICVTLASPKAPSTRDFIFYWATAQQLAHHANPYDLAQMTRIERAEGVPLEFAGGVMRNPPWAIPLVYALRFFTPEAGWLLWSAILLVSFVASVYLLWILYGRPRNRRYLLGISFGPALLSVVFGQTSLLLLFGLVLFLYLHRTQPFWAGVALWLCTLKPHLFLPFGVVMLAWVLVSKCYKLLVGTTIAMAVSWAVTLLIDPLAWTQYIQMARTSGIEKEYIPCLSFLLRHWISPNSVWLQYVPVTLGCAWALSYYWPRRHAWDWMTNGGPLMLVSVLVAPYTWIYDQGLVVPALLQGAFVTRSRNLLIALATLSALVEVALFRSLSYPPAIYLLTYWTAPAWLVWYLLATRSKPAQDEMIGDAL